MDEVLKINNARFLQRVKEKEYQDLFGAYIEKLDEKLSQIIVDKESNSLAMYVTSIHSIYRIHNNTVKKVSKKSTKAVTVLKGTPNGKLEISFIEEEKWTLNNVIFGRVYDFAQDIKPKNINSANYDNTIRGQFPQLLDPDHAEEIDKLRRWMQDGHISHYEFDDANPAYPKAGK